jgi:transposase
MRAAEHLTEMIGRHKLRIQELARQVMPGVGGVFTNKFGVADLAVLERYGDPRRLLALGEARLTRFITKCSNGQHGAERARAWRRAAGEALALYGEDPAVAYAEVAAELASEARLLRLLMAERDGHARAREEQYRKVDPSGLARSLPGVAVVGGPVVVASMGRPARFGNGAAFKAYSGLAPRANQTGDTDHKGQHISKAGSRRLRTQLVLSANVARKVDPQLAAIYWTQMVERGAHHNKAVCVVAARLAERAWTVMARGQPYVIQDLDGTPVSAAEARAIIAARYTVPIEIRQRRSSHPRRRAGKSPSPRAGGTWIAETPGASTTRRPFPPNHLGPPPAAASRGRGEPRRAQSAEPGSRPAPLGPSRRDRRVLTPAGVAAPPRPTIDVARQHRCRAFSRLLAPPRRRGWSCLSGGPPTSHPLDTTA